jgi:gluconokinase
MKSYIVVVMGVAGAGKTTVAARLAERLTTDLADADELHPPANIAKMSAGIPLTDEDRQPWLWSVARWIGDRRDRGGVMACSALKRPYRDLLRAANPAAWFAHLDGTPELLATRLADRRGHFLPAALLASQLADLEPLRPDEAGIRLDIAASPDNLVATAVRALTGV